MEKYLHPDVERALLFVHGYAGGCDDWLTIKKEIIKELPWELMKLFSKRDPITKKQRINDFERDLADRWSKLTGRSVVMPI